jgi:hypothetical protein
MEAKAGGAATAKSPAHACASGSGACEMMQQLLLPDETLTDVSSACCIPIRSQSVAVCGPAHSLIWECKNAQAETGNGARPAKPRAINKLRIRLIFM